MGTISDELSAKIKSLPDNQKNRSIPFFKCGNRAGASPLPAFTISLRDYLWR